MLIYLLLSVIAVYSSPWTEQDENDRIAMIMDQEKRAFDNEMRASQQARYRDEYRRNYGGVLANDKSSLDYEDKGGRRLKDRQRKPQPEPEYLREERQEDEKADEDNWCYFCASPLQMLGHDSRKAVTQFLNIRRTAFPKDAVTRECLAPRNFTALQKQTCKHRYCQTLVLADHNEGRSFVMRGCAEHFGAIDTKLMEEREDNTCTKLHDQLDIRECICRERKSCYAGKERRPSGAEGRGIRGIGSSFVVIALVFVNFF